MLIRRIIGSHLCKAVGGQQFCKQSRKLQTRIMFENYYSFFHYCLLSCRYAMFQKSILNEPRWGAQAVVRGDGAPGLTVATALATSQSWAFKKHTVKRKRKFRNQNFSTVKRKRKFRNQKFLRSKRKRKFRNQNFLRVKRKRKFRNQNYFSLKRKRKFRNQNF